jgi:protein arginine kinase activator
VVEGKIKEYHLCAACASKKGGIPYPVVKREKEAKDIKCSECGFAYSEFTQVGKLGCAECYNAFREKIKPLLVRIHDGSQHSGKILIKDERVITVKRNIRQLRKELKKALEREAYEKAARLKDELSHYEEELKKL